MMAKTSWRPDSGRDGGLMLWIWSEAMATNFINRKIVSGASTASLSFNLTSIFSCPRSSVLLRRISIILAAKSTGLTIVNPFIWWLTGLLIGGVYNLGSLNFVLWTALCTLPVWLAAVLANFLASLLWRRSLRPWFSIVLVFLSPALTFFLILNCFLDTDGSCLITTDVEDKNHLFHSNDCSNENKFNN